MQRYFFAIMLIALVSCKNRVNNDQKQDQNSNLLPTKLVDNPYTANGVDTAAMNAKPTMDFKDTLHNFGTIHEGERAEYDFEYTNNGKTPLIISSATGSCGCTVADYQRDPIAPGKSGEIKVLFSSAGKSGHQEKSVTLITNSKRSIHMLYITAEVVSK